MFVRYRNIICMLVVTLAVTLVISAHARVPPVQCIVLNLDLKKDKVLIGGEAVRRGAWGVGSPSASSRYQGKGSSVASALRDLFILCRHRTRVDVVQEGVHLLGT